MLAAAGGMFLLFASCGSLHGQELTEAPVSVQFSRIAKILVFERNLAVRARDRINIGIIYQEGVASSRFVKNELLRLAEESPALSVQNLSLSFTPVAISAESDVAAAIGRHKLDVIYITPMQSVNLGAILEITASKNVLSMTGVPQFAYGGVSVGILQKEDRCQIVITLPAAVEEGCNFDSRLLKLATVLKETGIK